MKYRVTIKMPGLKIGEIITTDYLGIIVSDSFVYNGLAIENFAHWIEEVVLKPKEESLEDKMMEVLELKSLQAINTRFIFVDKLAQIAKEHYKKHYLGVFDKAYNEWISRSGAGAIESVAITLRKAIREE